MRPALRRFFDMEPTERLVATEGAALLWLAIQQPTPSKCIRVANEGNRRMKNLYPRKPKPGRYVKVSKEKKRYTIGVRVNFKKAVATLITLAGGG